MIEPRWAPFLLVCADKKYAQSYRDDSLNHTDYTKGIHISVPDYLGIEPGSEFDYGGNQMKAENIQNCVHFQNHKYVFCKLKEGTTQC
tara:strand:- start:459 stop:722 length:264 start_codon:yes stop_codon:yes gene_type:complete